MIIFDLKCAPQGHVFEAWFGSSDDYEAQQARGLVTCPLCGAAEVEKAVMAPSVGAKSNRSGVGDRRAGGASEGAEDGGDEGRALLAGDPESVKQMLAAASAVQRRLLEGSESVGDRFADEARAIHLGETEKRAIHGRATAEEAESLIEEGIEVAPLPFPIVEPGDEN